MKCSRDTTNTSLTTEKRIRVELPTKDALPQRIPSAMQSKTMSRTHQLFADVFSPDGSTSTDQDIEWMIDTLLGPSNTS